MIKTANLIILLEEEREKLGMSIEQFAVHVGLTRTSYAHYLKDIRQMQQKAVRKVADKHKDNPVILNALASYALGIDGTFTVGS